MTINQFNRPDKLFIFRQNCNESGWVFLVQRLKGAAQMANHVGSDQRFLTKLFRS
jgi:hypothetical protein